MAKRGNGEGTIRKRPDGRFEWRYSDGRDPKTGKQRQRSIYAKTRGELEVKRRAVLAELERNGKILNPSKLTVEAWLDSWINDYCTGIADSTKAKYKSDIKNRIAPNIGQARLRDLSHEDIQKLVNSISLELRPKSVKNIHGTLHKALQKAVELGLISENPANNIELPRVIKETISPLPEMALKPFLSALEGDFYRNIILFALYTGMREMEVLGLTWDNVNLSTSTVTVKQQLKREHGEVSLVPPKSSKTRVVPLVPQALALLEEQKQLQEKWDAASYGIWNNPLNLCFTNEVGGALVALSVRKHFKKAAEEISLPELRFHDLRHTYAVYQIRAGVDYKTISENLGHYSVGFTLDTYGHVSREMEKEAAERLGAFFDGIT